jgi:arylsulfatase A-like enzyme
VGRVQAFLKQAGIYDDALVIVTADHGEAFLEHGRVGHNSTIYGEMLRVPLLVKLPSAWRARAEGVDVERLVTLADVPATILRLLAIAPPAHVRSSSLLARSPAARLIFLRSSQSDAPVLGVRTSRFKALTQAGAPPEIYDVLRDPSEKVNLIVENPVLHAGLSLILARAIREPSELRAGAREGEIAEKDKAMLRALGYL